MSACLELAFDLSQLGQHPVRDRSSACSGHDDVGDGGEVEGVVTAGAARGPRLGRRHRCLADASDGKEAIRLTSELAPDVQTSLHCCRQHESMTSRRMTCLASKDASSEVGRKHALLADLASHGLCQQGVTPLRRDRAGDRRADRAADGERITCVTAGSYWARDPRHERAISSDERSAGRAISFGGGFGADQLY
jgi:hypothetical protein